MRAKRAKLHGEDGQRRFLSHTLSLPHCEIVLPQSALRLKKLFVFASHLGGDKV
jgi:hypothetical protein